jgi:hypothetical protein
MNGVINKMMTIRFSGCNTIFRMSEYSDAEVERARAEAEASIAPFILPIDGKTGFPNFEVFEDGASVGGG